MTTGGWKTVLVDSTASLSFSQGCLEVAKESGGLSIPLPEIKVLMIESLYVNLSVFLLKELQKSGVKVIFCDETHNPCGEIYGYHGNYRQSGMIQKQIDWNETVKKECWREIVKQKIGMQIELLERVGLRVPDEMQLCRETVENGDETKREALAARLYFRTLFGKQFSRNRPNGINAGLNYGYSILLSMVNRQVVSSGYITNLGINHCSTENPYNLSSDIMEPFRPFIDEIVYQNKDKEFDGDYRRNLVQSFYRTMRFQKKKTDIQTGVDCYVSYVLKDMTSGEIHQREVGFCD